MPWLLVPLGLASVLPLRAAEKAEKVRLPPAPLSSLPLPAAAGTRSILVVDDDASANNVGGNSGHHQHSDAVYEELVAGAVGRDRARWTTAVVKDGGDGPGVEQLRPHSLVLWYTGSSYGRGADTLSAADERTIRSYLEQTGGAVILISPGYVNNLVYGQTWNQSNHPFLREVLGIDGCYGLFQRSSAGAVKSYAGRTFSVAHPGAAEAVFSVVNSNGAAIVFSAALPGTRDYLNTTAEVPVAVANPYGRGRIVYVGFTFENIPDQERPAAFEQLLQAALGPGAGGAVAIDPRLKRDAPGPAASPAAALPVPDRLQLLTMHAGWRQLAWQFPTGQRVEAFEIHRRDNGEWKRLARTSSSMIQPGSHRYDDRSFCTPGNAYKVVAIYFDGKKSESGVVSDPFSVQPDPLSAVRAVQSGPLEVTVTWVAEVDNPDDPQLGHTYRRYLIKGPGLPPEGRLIDPPITREWFRLPNAQMKYGPVSGSEQRRVVLTGVPLGRHEVRVFTDYGLGNVNLISPQAAVATVEVQRWDGPAVPGATLPGPAAPATRKGPAPGGVPGPGAGATKTELPPAPDRPATLRTAAPGPAPVNFRVEPLPPAQAGHVFRWQTVGDYQSRSIYRRDGDQWIFMIGDPNDASQVWNPSPTWEDTLVLQERWVIPGTVFKLEIRFKDGRRSEAELTYANPPQPVLPVVYNLRAEQTGHRRVRVSWTRRPPYSGRANEAVALESPGLPGGAAYSEVSEGVAEQWMDIHNVPEGRHTFKIGLQEIWGKRLPDAAHTTIDVRPVGDRVRVMLLGFRVGRKTTDDDLLDGDGRGDEVYFTSYQASVPVAAGALNVAPLGFVESVVIGDTNNFPSRQRGGTAGPTGGIRSGDAVPSAAALAPQPGLTPTRDRLPLLLWEGTLDRRLSAKVIGLTGWEWDTSPAVAPSGMGATWRDFWALGSTVEVMRDAARVATNFPTNGIRYQPLAPVSGLHRYEGTYTRGGTRPLGGLRAGPQTWECVAHGIVLTLENVEHLLGASAAAIVEAPLGMQRRPDGRQVDAGERDESEYTAILQVERLPMRPEEIGRSAGPWVVERHRPAGAVNERNIMTPLEAAGARRGEKLGK